MISADHGRLALEEVQPVEDAMTTGLEAVRARRAELRETIDGVERALAKPTGDREIVWGDAVHAALRNLARDFDAHIDVTEGPAGLHQAILSGDLRLANAVDALTREHQSIGLEVAQLVGDTERPVDDTADIRERATRMLGHLIRHRQRGADLIYEAYHADVGGDG